VRQTGQLSRHMASILLFCGLALAGGCARPVPPPRPTLITREQEDAARREEIKKLEKSLGEEIVKARANGATDADIEVLKSKYQAEIDRLKDQLSTNDKPAPDVPKGAGP